MDAIQFLQREAAMITQAPATFLAVSVAMGLIIWFFVDRSYRHRLADKDATIERWRAAAEGKDGPAKWG